MDNTNILLDEQGIDLTCKMLSETARGASFVAISDENKVYAKADFTEAPLLEDMIVLNNIEVSPGVRGVGVGQMLLSYAKERFKDAGYKAIYAKTFGDDIDLYPVNQFFDSAGFVCTNYRMRESIYDIKKIKASKFLEIMEKLKDDNKVKSFNEVSPKLLSEVRKKYPGILPPSLNNLDSSICRIAINNDIPTAIVICEPGDNTLFVPQISILPDNQDKTIIMRILNALILTADRKNKDTITVCTKERHIYEGLLQCGVTPESERSIQEFICQI